MSESALDAIAARGIVLPRLAQMIDPGRLVPADVQAQLRTIDAQAVHPLNLYRIGWKNRPASAVAANGTRDGSVYGGVNYIELPSALTGVDARICALVGSTLPTGAHKVGATYWPLVEGLVSGTFDPSRHRALWPSTGNYCRGGSYDSALLGCKAIAVLPEGMSNERFEWMEKLGTEVHKTPGSESNVKEVFDKAEELSAADADIVVFNQFSHFGNPLWHYNVTGAAMQEVFEELNSAAITAAGVTNSDDPKARAAASLRCRGTFVCQGSGGCMGAGYYLKHQYPGVALLGAGEAKRCATLLYNGFGEHVIEGIGDKHVPFIVNLRETDAVAALDGQLCLRIGRLFNEPAGHACLRAHGVSDAVIATLPQMGISSIANMLGCIKMAKYYEMTGRDVLVTVATDSMAMYQSRLDELNAQHGEYTNVNAEIDYAALHDVSDDWFQELSFKDRKRMHNLKYYTWVEQRGKTAEELNEQWTSEQYWRDRLDRREECDRMIGEFNAQVASRRIAASVASPEVGK